MGRPTLARTLAAVAAQTHRPLELVLVNASGRPHPPLPALPPPHQGFALKLVDPGRPLGRAEAANHALDAARGDWLMFLDDDDEIAPDHVERLWRAVSGQADARAANAGVQLLQPDGHVSTVLDDPVGGIDLWSANRLPIHAVLFARSLRDEGLRVDESLAVYEDWDFWFQVSRRTRFVHVPGVSATYHLVGDSGTTVWHSAEESARLRAPFYAKWLPVLRADELAALTAAVEDGRANVAELRLRLGEARQQAAEAERRESALRSELEAERQRGHALRQALAEADGDRRALRASLSWRLTAPLRWLRRGGGS